jgi:hypothetical protein
MENALAWAYIQHAVNIAKYNEIINQLGRGNLHIHLWNYTKYIKEKFKCSTNFGFQILLSY